ncbi:tetratricopeptide repeat protein [Actinoplanes italicus]|uniref:tetratricopeptide repeat protein n=1 Tax=Actinoplanes italicus TaxID=113567 RepID=UPI001EF1E893|nr:tetratricopeptide repeat protein [Actinoplanes italicus]
MTLSEDAFGTLPDPAQASSFDDLADWLRRLKVWAGDPSYETIKDRVNAAWTAAGRPAGELATKSTVAYCFRPGRRRLDTDLVLAVVQAMHPDTGYVASWRQALRVVSGEIEAVSQVRVQDSLPQDLAGFTGRAGEIERLHHALRGGDAVVISAIAGMAGVGKTQLAVHAGHLLHRERPFDQVLFVNLRGFDPDPAQPPAGPAAVLEGFLRLLGMPGQQIPHTLDARAAAYRKCLTGIRALVVLDNAAAVEQVRPLLPATPGCLTLVTSRRSLAGLQPATHLSVDVFAPDEALALLAQAVPGVPVGQDPHAAARIVQRCGYLPLALSLIAGHIRNTPGWTLTDHADRLDERHQDRRLDTAVELALNLSYQHLPAQRRRLFRLAALHPGEDLDAYAAAALADIDLPAARDHLHHLCRDHLLQQSAPGRYTFHDLVRVYATVRATDEDRPAERRTALTRLFDFYLAAAATAMNTLHPAEAHRRPVIPPAGTPAPDLTDADTAREWLDTERPALVAVAVHTAGHGWPSHTTRLSRTLFRYLDGGHHTDALTVHGHAHHAARDSGDATGQAHALTNLGAAHSSLGRHGPAIEHYQQARELFRQAGDPAGEARTLINLGAVAAQTGQYRTATDRFEQALILHRQTGDRTGEASAHNNLGDVEGRLGHHRVAVEHFEQALALHRQAGNRDGEARTLNSLGEVELRWGRNGPAGDHLRQARTLSRRLGNHAGEAWALDSLGTLDTRLGRPAQAARHHQQALTIFRDTGERDGEAQALNGLGEAAHTTGDTADALTHHTAAHIAAADTGNREQQARALTGLGHVHHTLGDPALAREHYRHALALYTDLGMPEADQVRTHLAALDDNAAEQR